MVWHVLADIGRAPAAGRQDFQITYRQFVRVLGMTVLEILQSLFGNRVTFTIPSVLATIL